MITLMALFITAFLSVTDDDISKAVYDFVLVTSCNHTVVSRGTYSMWIGLLSAGEIYTEYGAVIPPCMQE